MMSRTFWSAIGFLLFVGGAMALVYLVGGLIENARGAVL